MKRSWIRHSDKPMKRSSFRSKKGINHEVIIARRGPTVRRQNGSHKTKDGRIIMEGKDYQALRIAVYLRDAGTCAICKRYVEWADYELDHYKDINGNPLLSRGMNGSRRHDSMESCRVTCSFCNSDRVRKERSVNSLAEATA